MGNPSPPFALACHDSLLMPRPPCVRAASPPHRYARPWLRSTPSNGWTACRMLLHRICGVRFRSYARAYAYRGLTTFASLSMAVSVSFLTK
ncbi:MAG: hypothetical protein JAZ17_25845 [Candidatus Thiodiazotropha endolucinida]|nr:hypothetical protein [Candidatus Thiodiazotropha taylori]MCG8097001.1 hypothetical protein [Candidatus Thiodiazotropha endolucinida]MCG7891241.1 hypothetical protein [Candidatus Thiodiazotropha taylori]MCG8031457.1 hypothetical protein [Candidatus Thiodiazotropha taylori]MCG8044371.1 hypothetical protein [Candidatus Thiodiazotropha taylori]